jgi:prepilin-type N-terminal cleavage/methylation domain-containing protein
MKKVAPNQKGFTLMEILVVLGILAILTTIGMTSFRNSSVRVNLEQQSAIALSLVEEARNNSLASLNNSEYGIRFSSTTVTLFQGKTYSSGASNKTHVFTNGVYASPINISGGNDIYFNRLTGEPSATGTVTFKITADQSLFKVLIINGTGIIEIN